MDLKTYKLSLCFGTAICQKICHEFSVDSDIVNNYVLNSLLDIFCQISEEQTTFVKHNSMKEQQYLLNFLHNNVSITIVRPVFFNFDTQGEYFIPVNINENLVPFLDSISFEIMHPVTLGLCGSHIYDLTPDQVLNFNNIYSGLREDLKDKFSAIQSFLHLLLRKFSLVDNLHYILKILYVFSKRKLDSPDFVIFNNVIKEFVKKNNYYTKMVQYDYYGWKNIAKCDEESIVLMSFTMYNTFSSVYNELAPNVKLILYNLIRDMNNGSGEMIEKLLKSQ